MGYIKASFLKDLNPSIKILIMVLMTVVLTVSYGLYVPIISFVFFFIMICILGKINPFSFLKRLIPFLIFGISLGLFLWLANGFADEKMISCFAIGLRVMNFSLLSVAFFLTTEPRDFVMSLIQQCRVPYVIGYSFLAAYRFLPTFGDELKKIALAKEMRGEGGGHSIFSTIKNVPRYMVPLLASAIRKGERVALAMDGRGFRAYKDRSYYQRLTVKRNDYLVLAVVVVFIIVIVVTANLFGGLGFSLGLKGGY